MAIGNYESEIFEMKDFRELKVWDKSHQLVLTSYKLTSSFPKQEIFGMVSQIRRCSASIPANIAEAADGWGTLNCTVSCRSRADQPMSWSIPSCSLETW